MKEAEKKPKWLAKSLPAFAPLALECCMIMMLEVEDGEAEQQAQPQEDAAKDAQPPMKKRKKAKKPAKKTKKDGKKAKRKA